MGSTGADPRELSLAERGCRGDGTMSGSSGVPLTVVKCYSRLSNTKDMKVVERRGWKETVIRSVILVQVCAKISAPLRKLSV